MDEEPGKVIDGTARARHWRRSRPRSTAETEGPLGHSEAPKSIASSLLVQPATLEGEPVPLLVAEPANGNGLGSASPADENGASANDRNIFLSPDAAVTATPRHSSGEISAVALRLARRARAAARRVRGIRGWRPQLSPPSTRVGALLGLAGACALVVALSVFSQPTSSRPHPVGDANRTLAFGRLKDEQSLGLTASPFASVPKTAHPYASDAKTIARYSVVRVRDTRKPATRILVAHARSQTYGGSRATSTVARASAATNRASNVPSPTPANEASAQPSPAPEAVQQQPVHYQPPPQPAGPTVRGGAVGAECNPKCS